MPSPSARGWRAAKRAWPDHRARLRGRGASTTRSAPGRASRGRVARPAGRRTTPPASRRAGGSVRPRWRRRRRTTAALQRCSRQPSGATADRSSMSPDRAGWPGHARRASAPLAPRTTPALTARAPMATRPTAAARRVGGMGRATAIAALKKGRTAAIAVPAAPASARCRGSHTPCRSAGGSASDAAASPSIAAATSRPPSVMRRSASRETPCGRFGLTASGGPESVRLAWSRSAAQAPQRAPLIGGPPGDGERPGGAAPIS